MTREEIHSFVGEIRTISPDIHCNVAGGCRDGYAMALTQGHIVSVHRRTEEVKTLLTHLKQTRNLYESLRKLEN